MRRDAEPATWCIFHKFRCETSEIRTVGVKRGLTSEMQIKHIARDSALAYKLDKTRHGFPFVDRVRDQRIGGSRD